MIDEVFKLKLIGTKDCFLHFSIKGQNKITNSSSSVIKLKNDSIRNELYFTSNPSFCSGFDENTVGISSVYANHLGLNDNETVILSSHNQVPVVKKVFVSALTQDDFEIMEMSQYELQLAMLNQIRVISVGQIITTWFSKTMYCSICVDSMEPLLKVGKIEQFTDFIISPILKELSNNQSEQNCADVSKDLSEENVNGLNINSFIDNENIIEDSPLKLNKAIKKKEHSGIFRIIAGKDISDCCDDLHNPIAHPYNAFVNEDILTLWSNKSSEDSAVVCFATKVPVKFTKGFYEQSQKGVGSGVYIRLYPIREDCKTIPPVQNGCNWKNQGLYLSDTVKSLLSVKTGSKVKLKLFVPNLDEKVILVDITIPNILPKCEVGNWFREELPSSSNVLINNKSPMPMRSSSGIVQTVVVTFWPDTILCWPFSSAEMKTCKLNISYCLDKETEKSDDLDSEQDKQDSDDENGSDEAHGKRAFESISQLSGSLKDIIKDGLISFEQCLKLSSVPVLPQNLSLQQNSNILCVGSGAYFLCDWLCNWVSGPPNNVYISKIDCKALKGKKGDNLQKRLVEKLQKCIYYQPSLLVLLDIDGIAGTPSQPENKVEEIFFRGMSRMVRDILIEYQADQHICVLATARTTSCINTEILGPQGNHLFSTLLQIPTLTKVDRVIIVKEIIKMKLNKNNVSHINFEEFANRTEGYSYEDLTLLVDKALFKAWQRKALNKKCDELQVTLEDLLFAVDSYSPAHLHSVNLYKSSDHSWLSVGGMKALKESLTEIIIWPSKYREVYEQCPLRSESGVLLYGVPGTGKTLLASALAGEAGLNFISIKGPELLSKYIGASEEAVRNVFEKAKKAKPCILFFDEFDSLAPRRGHDSSGVMDRVVNQLLTQMDGVEERTGVYIVAATSRPDLLDPALLRPGRIGHLLHCPLPEVDDRLATMTVLCKKLVLDSDCNLSFIAEQTDRYSGADLQAVIYGAQMMAYDELNQNNSNSARELDDFTIEVGPDISKKLVVKNKHLLSSLNDTKPSLRLEELRRYNRIYENFQKLRSKTNQGDNVPVVMDQKVSLA